MFGNNLWRVEEIFDDDEPLPSHTLPSPPPPPPAAATIKTFTEFPAIAAAASPSNFTVLIKIQFPPTTITTTTTTTTHASTRVPIDLVAVLDVSGSMNGQKLALVKRSLHFIISTLSPSDRLSVVAFSTSAHRALPLISLSSDHNRRRASAAVSSLSAGGNTNIKAGLEAATRVLQHRRHKNPVAGLILLSDGQDSGIHFSGTSQDYLYSCLLPTHNTVPIHTFGFGSDHDPKAMHAIAAASGGTFSFIEDERDVQDAFAMCIGGLLSVVAQQTEVLVTTSSAAAGVHITSVSSGSYKSRILNHGLAAAVEFGDLYADEEKDFHVNLSVPVAEPTAAAVALLAGVKCSYKDPLSGQPIHVEGEPTVVRRPENLSPEDQVVSLTVDVQSNRILVGESIREAQERAEKKDFEGAKAVLSRRREVVLQSASAQAGDGLCGWLHNELEEIEKRMANVRVYEESGRAYALSGMSSHLQQRAAAGAVGNTATCFAARVGQSGGVGGFGNTATPTFGTPAFGTTATPVFGTATAFGTTATPVFGTATGFGNTATPTFGTAVDFGNSATPAFGTAVDFGNRATPAFGTAAGFGNTETAALGTTVAFGTAQTAAIFGASNNIGYQTNAMREMVQKSQSFTLQNPFGGFP